MKASSDLFEVLRVFYHLWIALSVCEIGISVVKYAFQIYERELASIQGLLLKRWKRLRIICSHVVKPEIAAQGRIHWFSTKDDPVAKRPGFEAGILDYNAHSLWIKTFCDAPDHLTLFFLI
jgi:hypothetical protein